MSVVPVESRPLGGGPRLLLRGEGLIAVPSLAIAVILLSAVAVVGFWVRGNEQLAARGRKQSEVKMIAGVLAGAAESSIEAGDLSGLRRMVLDAGRTRDLDVCRITLPSGGVVADADPKKINVKALPARWDGTVDAAGALAKVAQDGVGAACEAVTVPGRGAVLLEVVAPVVASSAAAWTTLLGAGVSAVIGMAGLLMVYRKMRAKLMPLGLIRDGLRALAAGETARDALALSPAMGPEAVAWNGLLSEAEGLRNEAVAERAKEALGGGTKQARSDLEHGCDALAVGLVIVDDRGFVRHANGAAATLLQRAKEKMMGAEAASLFDDEPTRQVVAAAVSGGTGGGSASRKTVEFERNGGVLRVQVRPLRREDHPGAVVTIEDVTQQRVAEASRHSFVAQTTHELRTPLTNIRLYLETLLEDGGAGADDPATRAKCLNVVNLEVRRLERMVGEMLSVSEIEAGSLKLKTGDVRLDKMFDELRADYAAAAADKKIALKFELPPKWPVIQGDREKLAAALHNLIGNAVKYTPNGGKVTVSVTAEAKRLIVMVADSGIGIAEEEQGLVFERFYRAKDPRVEKVTGTGLGLTLAREVARLHGGDVTLKSAVDQGSTFTLVVPVMAQAA